jgi:lysophospholipase L1-like esterase
MTHVVLIGDSVFDNAAYVPRGEDVAAQFARRAPADWRVDLRAQDGATISGVAAQIRRLPEAATHLVVSVGGNDALRVSGVLTEPVRGMADALARLGAIRDAFAAAYETMLDDVLATGRPAAVCTIYDPAYPEPERRALASTALCVLNDAILRAATRRGAPAIDLRLVCDAAADFANPIEPSAAGGAKIAAAIVRLVEAHDFTRRTAAIYA